MWALYDILNYSFSSVIWGLLIAIACMALFVFLIKGWYKDATFSPVSYIIGAILFIFLSFQCVLIVGSLKIISMTDDYKQRITSIVESVYSPSDMVSMPQASDVIDTIIDEFPIAMADELRSFMRWYIFRRILWCLGFVIVGAICVLRSMSKTRQTKKSYQHSSAYYENF